MGEQKGEDGRNLGGCREKSDWAKVSLKPSLCEQKSCCLLLVPLLSGLFLARVNKQLRSCLVSS